LLKTDIEKSLNERGKNVELRQIKELMAAMRRTGTKKLSIKKEGFELELEQQEEEMPYSVDNLELSEDFSPRAELARRANAALSRGKELQVAHPHAAHDKNEEEAAVYVTSPMVGTFYASPTPDDAPFVKIGDPIDKNTIVCIVEAMKVMNEVKANISGIVAEVLIENGHPVEFGTKLYRIT